MQRLGSGESKAVAVRFSVEDYETVVLEAGKLRMSVSEYVRSRTLESVVGSNPTPIADVGRRTGGTSRARAAVGETYDKPNHHPTCNCLRCKPV